MREIMDIKAALAALDRQTADSLEAQDLEFKEWPADYQQGIEIAVRAAVCMANGGGGTVVLGIHDRKLGRPNAILGVPSTLDTNGLKRAVYEKTAPKLTPEFLELSVPEGTGRVIVMQVYGGLAPYTNSAGAGWVRLTPSPDLVRR